MAVWRYIAWGGLTYTWTTLPWYLRVEELVSIMTQDLKSIPFASNGQTFEPSLVRSNAA